MPCPGVRTGAVKLALIVMQFTPRMAQFAALLTHFAAVVRHIVVERLNTGMVRRWAGMSLGERRSERKNGSGQQELAHGNLLPMGSRACDHAVDVPACD